jgi:hypothetical protein
VKVKFDETIRDVAGVTQERHMVALERLVHGIIDALYKLTPYPSLSAQLNDKSLFVETLIFFYGA